MFTIEDKKGKKTRDIFYIFYRFHIKMIIFNVIFPIDSHKNERKKVKHITWKRMYYKY
jgi:hypothetical protein